MLFTACVMDNDSFTLFIKYLCIYQQFRIKFFAPLAWFNVWIRSNTNIHSLYKSDSQPVSTDDNIECAAEDVNLKTVACNSNLIRSQDEAAITLVLCLQYHTPQHPPVWWNWLYIRVFSCSSRRSCLVRGTQQAGLSLLRVLRSKGWLGQI